MIAQHSVGARGKGQATALSIQILYGYLAFVLILTGALVMAMSFADQPATSGLVGVGESQSRSETGCGPLIDTSSWDDSPDFELDIVPILAAAGCNSASCHGAAAGQAGFRLSLFCGDPDFDYDQIVRELGGRRIHRTRPKDSLLLLKATQTLEHGGDERFDTDSRSYRIIRSWIAQGAQRGGDWEVERIDAETSDIQPEVLGASCQLRIIATLRHRSTGETTSRDVTEWSVLESLDESALAVEGSSVRFLEPGRGFISARFANCVTTIALDLPWGASLDPSAFPRGNWVDDVVYRGMARMGLEPVAEAAPHVVARRLYWDLAGRIAPPERIHQWLEGPSDDEHYAAVVDELLSSPEFEALWSYQLANWLRASTMGNDPRELEPYFGWIQQVIRDDRSLVDVMRDTLQAEGPLSQNPAVGFYRATADPRMQAERVSEIWMGVQLRCANCHNHPLDRWTRADYHGLAAAFVQLDFGNPLRRIPGASLLDPASGIVVPPKLPGGEVVAGADPRHALADWLSQPSQPYLERAFANRVWGTLMGQGLFEPFDDWRDTNPVIHAELLEELAARFRQGGHRLRPLIRDIVMSQAYRRGAEPQAERERDWFQVFRPRRVPLLLLRDAWCDVLDVWGLEPGATGRALESIGTANRAQNLLGGSCDRQRECTALGSQAELEVAQALMWLNGSLLNELIENPSSWVNKQLQLGNLDAEILDSFYWRALGRPISDRERRAWIALLNDANEADQRQVIWQDLVWSVLTCEEFIRVW